MKTWVCALGLTFFWTVPTLATVSDFTGTWRAERGDCVKRNRPDSVPYLTIRLAKESQVLSILQKTSQGEWSKISSFAFLDQGPVTSWSVVQERPGLHYRQKQVTTSSYSAQDSVLKKEIELYLVWHNGKEIWLGRSSEFLALHQQGRALRFGSFLYLEGDTPYQSICEYVRQN